jgi:phosphatidylinositol 3-kinase
VHAQTPYKHFKNGRVWSQWLTLPANYSSLPSNTQLAITLWDLSPVNPNGGDTSHHIPFGGTTIPLYDEDATLRTGRQKCRIWRHKAADGFSDTTTPWQEPKRRGRRGTVDEPVIVSEKQVKREAELERLVGLMKKHEMGEITENKWLDQMVFRQIEKMERQSVKDSTKPKTSAGGSKDNKQGQLCADGDPDHIDGAFFLYIELPRFDHPIVFTDHEYPAPPLSSIKAAHTQAGAVNFKPPPEVQLGPGIHSEGNGHSDTEGGRATKLIQVYDPEVGYADNPAEAKHRRLIRGQRNALDRDLKPNPKMRDFLNKVLSYGPTVELSDKEKDEIWRFRHHLTRDKRALTKLAKSVNWNEPAESRQAIALLPKWAEIDVDDALELLGPSVRNPEMRTYAVDRLRKADDEELLLYLLQLVQALKFEPPVMARNEHDPDSSLASFVIARSAANFKLGNFLYWYLMVEMDEEAPTQDAENRKLFARVSYDFMQELERTPTGQARRKILLRQAEFITVLSKISKDVVNSRADRTKKTEQLKKFLADPRNELVNMDPPLPLPLDPNVQIVGAVPDDANVFKSTLLPLYINFKTESGEKYPLIFKTGDDLRQDQLVVQIIALMDRLLLKENLDLKLTPYRILATSTLAGAVQFIPSTPVSAILGSNKYKGSILGYLRYNNPAAASSPSILGVRKEAMDNYVKSVAGYCVVTYLLGVGDRHLDNLLITPDGHFLHIDYGYILGRDPKPMAPLMKLSREMVEGMGGSTNTGESQFETFRQYCFTAYTTLRRSSSLILNLFSLMQEANIPGLAIFGDQAVTKVEERFKLDVSEDEAIAFFAQLIDREMGAWGPVMIDKLHGLVQGWRA